MPNHSWLRACIVLSTAAVFGANMIVGVQKRKACVPFPNPCSDAGPRVPLVTFVQSFPVLFLGLLLVSIVVAVLFRKRLGNYVLAVPFMTLVTCGAVALFV